MLYLYLFWNIFAITVGPMEARVHHWRGSDIGNDKWIHSFYFSVRAVVWLSLSSIIFIAPDIQALPKLLAWSVFLLCSLLSFPFFHSGSKFTARRIMDNRLDLHWFSHSKTTNANINLKPVARTGFALFGILTMIIVFWDYRSSFTNL